MPSHRNIKLESGGSQWLRHLVKHRNYCSSDHSHLSECLFGVKAKLNQQVPHLYQHCISNIATDDNLISHDKLTQYKSDQKCHLKMRHFYFYDFRQNRLVSKILTTAVIETGKNDAPYKRPPNELFYSLACSKSHKI